MTRQSHTILVVDDESSVLESKARLLRSVGHVVHTCQHWSSLAATILKEQPDLVLLDYDMPFLKGDEICSILKRTALLPGMKIVICSDEPDDSLARIASQCGADGHLNKDVRGQTVLSYVDELLSPLAAVS